MRTRTLGTGIAVVVLGLVGLSSYALVKLWDEHGRESEIGRALFPAKPIDHAELNSFGDELVPRLREIANSSKAESIMHKAYGRLAERNQFESNLLVVEILSGATRVNRDNALFQFDIGITTQMPPPSIFKDRGFKQAVIAMADSNSPHTRAIVAEYIGDLAWDDAVPKLRELIRDTDLDVRETAAESLLSLTGEVVPIERPKTSFPKVALRDDLLTNYRFMERVRGNGLGSISYVRWFDGLPCRTSGQGDDLVALDSEDREIGRLSIKYDARTCRDVLLPDGSVQLLVETRSGSKVVAVNEARQELWSRRIDIEQVATLYSDKGVEGLIVRGEGRLVHGLDLSGKNLWDIKISHVLYGLYSHAELPGLFVAATGGDAAVCRVKDQSASQILSLQPSGTYLRAGLLLPDVEGDACIILEGERHDDSIPMVMGYDLEGHQEWSSELPGKVRALVAIEPANSQKLVALLTEPGTLFIFDTEGTLHYEGQVPRVEGDGDYYLFGFAAGQERNETWTLAISDSEGTHMFDLNP